MFRLVAIAGHSEGGVEGEKPLNAHSSAAQKHAAAVCWWRCSLPRANQSFWFLTCHTNTALFLTVLWLGNTHASVKD